MGLVAYDSSDEDEDSQVPIEKPENPPVKPLASSSHNTIEKPLAQPHQPPVTQLEPVVEPSSSSSKGKQPDLTPAPGPSLHPTTTPTPIGPSLPPNQSSQNVVDMSFLERESQQEEENTIPSDPPKSPYTQTRTLLHDLSLPPPITLSIPHSPPGSPTQSQSALTAKFDTFLKLKRTNSIHFNQRLASNPGMRNPALTQKLLDFVGVETGEWSTPAEFQTTLNRNLWDPDGFPHWARCGDLRVQQERLSTLAMRRKGARVEFVSGGASGSGSSSRSTASGSMTGKRKARW
ncbi:hypothetical protein QBC38DRAFT_464028 [Podospora fimiseda]|uniref:HCNGP-like protein n=1 Tax=Podospora fimiseda TaxID=252190 RepID=A0AAN7BZ89_9PEZI|nr:hypothetical protein QBC38DRAFT_464028 [Podospora fimiseda]